MSGPLRFIVTWQKAPPMFRCQGPGVYRAGHVFTVHPTAEALVETLRDISTHYLPQPAFQQHFNLFSPQNFPYHSHSHLHFLTLLVTQLESGNSRPWPRLLTKKCNCLLTHTQITLFWLCGFLPLECGERWRIRSQRQKKLI